jgi:hypothetical protein
LDVDGEHAKETALLLMGGQNVLYPDAAHIGAVVLGTSDGTDVALGTTL